MHCKDLLFLLFAIALGQSNILQAISPIEPKDVLTQEEINKIIAEKDFFMFKNLDDDGPIWNHLDRKYGKHNFKDRTEVYTLEDFIHHTLSDAFPVKYKIEELYRSGLAHHIALGKLLPRFNLSIGQGVVPVDVNNFATNIFGFILPQNWFSLIQAKEAYKATEHLFMKTILDQYYAAELAFIEQHQLIQDFEIRNFYLIHLQLLCQYLGLNDMENLSLAGTYAAIGTDMATNRGNIKLKFDDLAKIMAMRTDRQGRFATSSLNIDNIKDFPARVKNLEEMGRFYNNQEDFIKEVLKRSIELQSIKEFYRVAQLGIGVTAFGSIFSATDSATDNYVRLGINLGYDTLPSILTSASNARTASINVEEQFVNMVDLARRAFDASTNALGGFTEATRSIKINRQAFAVHLAKVIDGAKKADGLILRDLSNLMDAEFKLNNALHGTLKAHALMRRLLVTEEEHIFSYLPPNHQIEKLQRLFLAEHPGYSRHGSHMEDVIHHLHHHKDLQEFLAGKYVNLDNKTDNHDEDTVKKIITKNLPQLISRRKFFHNKHRKFYLILHQYIVENNIRLTFSEHRELRSRAGLPVDLIEPR